MFKFFITVLYIMLSISHSIMYYLLILRAKKSVSQLQYKTLYKVIVSIWLFLRTLDWQVVLYLVSVHSGKCLSSFRVVEFLYHLCPFFEVMNLVKRFWVFSAIYLGLLRKFSFPPEADNQLSCVISRFRSVSLKDFLPGSFQDSW